MSAKQGFGLVIGLIALAFIEGLVKHFCPNFPITEVLAFQSAISGGIITTKLINDVQEMKNGIRPKANGNGSPKP